MPQPGHGTIWPRVGRELPAVGRGWSGVEREQQPFRVDAAGGVAASAAPVPSDRAPAPGLVGARPRLDSLLRAAPGRSLDASGRATGELPA